MCRYAVHNAGISFTLKKVGEALEKVGGALDGTYAKVDK